MVSNFRYRYGTEFKMPGYFSNGNMDEESSFCSSCKSILQYSSSISELHTQNEKIYELTEKNNIEKSIENCENDLNIIDTTHDIQHVHKKQEAVEDLVEKLMVHTNKKVKHIDLPNKLNLKNNAREITCVESVNKDFSSKINYTKISYAQDIKQNNDCKTVKAKYSMQDEKKNTEMINNESQTTAQNILDSRKNVLEISQSVLEMSNYIDNMRKLILYKINKRQDRVLSNNKKEVKLDLLGKDFSKM